MNTVPVGHLKGMRLRGGNCEWALVALPVAKVLVKELSVGNVDWAWSMSYCEWRLIIVLDHIFCCGFGGKEREVNLLRFKSKKKGTNLGTELRVGKI